MERPRKQPIQKNSNEHRTPSAASGRKPESTMDRGQTRTRSATQASAGVAKSFVQQSAPALPRRAAGELDGPASQSNLRQAHEGSSSPINDNPDNNMRIDSPSMQRALPTSRTRFITTKDWNYTSLLQKGRHFHTPLRVSIMDKFERVEKALAKFERDGVPLVITDCHQHSAWPDGNGIFTIDWLIRKYGNINITARNIHNCLDEQTKLADFVAQSRSMGVYASDNESKRLYAKDAPCPAEWKQWLQESGTVPLNLRPCSTNDLLQYLYEYEAVENLMCYYGIGDTFTPCHKDLCGSTGHNLMCRTEDGGSSYWFMTTSGSAPVVAKHFQDRFGQELDWESYVVSVEDFAEAPFDVYVVEQKLGDLVLVPPRSCHQVVNRGGLTMKMSWSRMTMKGLEIALHHELPIYRRVCRKEHYRVKTVVYRSLLHYTGVLASSDSPHTSQSSSTTHRAHPPHSHSPGDNASPSLHSFDPPSSSPLPLSSGPTLDEDNYTAQIKALESLLQLFDEILMEEYTHKHSQLQHVLSAPSQAGWNISVADDTRLVLRPPSSAQPKKGKEKETNLDLCTMYCDFCGADLFQSFFECQKCIEPGAEIKGPGDGLIMCGACYVEGRSCLCTKMEPLQCRSFDALLQDRNRAADVLSRTSETTWQKITESDLQGRDDVLVFESACALHEIANEMDQKKPSEHHRSCRTMVEGLPAHRVSNALWVLCCSCRHSKCFKHMLEKDGIHSAEAILAHRESKDHSYWHKLHTDKRTQDVRNAKSIRSIMSTGSRWSCRERLTVAALYYGKCNPLSRSMKRGWYDVEVSQDGDGRLPLPETHMTFKPSVRKSSRAAGTKRLRPVVELRTRKKVRLTISDHPNLQQRDSEREDTQHHPDDDDEKIASNYGDDLARTINMANTRPMVTAGAENQRHQRIMSSEPPESIPVAAESSSTQPQASAVGARLRGRGGRPPGIPITKSTDTSPSAPVDKDHIGNDSSRRDETSPPEDIVMELSSSIPLAVNPTPGSSDVKTAPSVEEDFEHVTTQYALYIKVMTDFKCRIESLEGEVRGKEKQLKRVNKEFAQERDRLERQTSLLQQKTDQVLDLQAQLKEKDQELTDELLQRISQLSEKERLLLEKEKHNEQRALEKASQASAREHQLQEIEHQLREKEYQLQEKDHQLQEKERQLREDEHQLREKEHQLREEEHQLREKEHQLQEKDNKLQEEEHQLRERERTIAMQTQQRDEQHEQIAAQPQPEAPPKITQDQGDDLHSRQNSVEPPLSPSSPVATRDYPDERSPSSESMSLVSRLLRGRGEDLRELIRDVIHDEFDRRHRRRTSEPSVSRSPSPRTTSSYESRYRDRARTPPCDQDHASSSISYEHRDGARTPPYKERAGSVHQERSPSLELPRDSWSPQRSVHEEKPQQLRSQDDLIPENNYDDYNPQRTDYPPHPRTNFRNQNYNTPYYGQNRRFNPPYRNGRQFGMSGPHGGFQGRNGINRNFNHTQPPFAPGSGPVLPSGDRANTGFPQHRSGWINQWNRPAYRPNNRPYNPTLPPVLPPTLPSKPKQSRWDVHP